MDEQERDFLLPTYIYVDTFIIDECKKPCRLYNQTYLYMTTCFFFVVNAFVICINILFDCMILH